MHRKIKRILIGCNEVRDVQYNYNWKLSREWLDYSLYHVTYKTNRRKMNVNVVFMKLVLIQKLTWLFPVPGPPTTNTECLTASSSSSWVTCKHRNITIQYRILQSVTIIGFDVKPEHLQYEVFLRLQAQLTD